MVVEKACELAFTACKDGTKSTQIVQLIEKFDERGGKESIGDLKVHILYQVARDYIDQRTGQKLLDTIIGLEKEHQDSVKARESISELLLNLKMLFKVFDTKKELLENEENKKFDKMIENFIKL